MWRYPALAYFLLATSLIAAGNAVRAQFGGAIPGREGEWPYIDHWMLLQYLVDYGDVGFVRRGLVGTLLPGDPALGATALVLAAATLPAVLVAAVMAPRLARLEDRTLAFAFAVSPALFWQMGFDLGRFDALNMLVVLGIVLCPWRWALMAAPVMLLIHEAAAAIFLPVLFALHWQRFGLGAPMMVAGTAVLGVTAALIGLSARPDAAMIAALYPTAMADPWVISSSIEDNLSLAWRHFAEERSARQFWMLGPPLLYVAALVFVGARMLQQASGAWVVLAAALSPLLLPLVAVDYARWIALAGANVILVALLIGRQKPVVRPPRAAVVVLAAAGAFGPMGILFGFPGAQFFLGRLF
jgi:hypothetical protein